MLRIGVTGNKLLPCESNEAAGPSSIPTCRVSAHVRGSGMLHPGAAPSSLCMAQAGSLSLLDTTSRMAGGLLCPGPHATEEETEVQETSP